jgi:hypothetical protein
VVPGKTITVFLWFRDRYIEILLEDGLLSYGLLLGLFWLHLMTLHRPLVQFRLTFPLLVDDCESLILHLPIHRVLVIGLDVLVLDEPLPCFGFLECVSMIVHFCYSGKN